MYTQFEAAEFKNGNGDHYFYLQLGKMLELVKKWSEERDVASSEAIDELISYLGKEKYIKRKQHWARVVRNPVEYEWLGQIYQLDQELSKKANDDARLQTERDLKLRGSSETLIEQEYTLKISYLGFDTKSIDISVDDSKKDLIKEEIKSKEWAKALSEND